jgi:hypothetical protein
VTFPTPWTVQYLAYAGTTEDDRGNEIPAYAAPVDWKVYGWSAPQSSEPKVAGVESVVVTLELFAPARPVGDQDRIVVNGDTYEVVGDPEDYDHGPFGFAPGMVVNLTRGR